MHKLEYAIFIISEFLEKNSEKYKELAKELKNLASVSHNYQEPPPDNDLSEEWMDDLKKRYRQIT